MSKPVELVAFTVRLAQHEHKALADLAADEHRSLGAEARRAIVKHIVEAGGDIEERVA